MAVNVKLLISLFAISFINVHSLRFGQRAQTLHFPLKEVEENTHRGVQFIEADIHGKGDVSESVKNSRVRRSASSSSHLPNSTMAAINSSHYQMYIHWAGKGSNVIIAITKDPHTTPLSTSMLYISRDYGATFINKTLRYGNTTIVMDRFYNSPEYNSHYIFTDIIHNLTVTTTNYGYYFHITPVRFSPKTIAMHPTNYRIMLGSDEDDPLKRLYLTRNFGRTWNLLTGNVKSYYWGEQNIDPIYTLYVERQASYGLSTVVKYPNVYSYRYLQHSQVISGLVDFEVRKEFMFATKRIGYGSTSSLQLWVSRNRGRFMLAEIPNDMRHLDYYIADASEGIVMLCINHNASMSHLYVSDATGIKYTLSLERIVYYNPNGSLQDTWLRYFDEESFADIHRVDGLRGIFIASQLQNGSFTVDNQTSYITFDNGGSWDRINAPRRWLNGSSTHCYYRCSLHLTQALHRLYPGTRSVDILSKKSAIGMIMATGVLGNTLKISSTPSVYLSTDAGVSWSQVLNDTYYYSFGDHGGVIVAVKQYVPVGEIRYSTDMGETWDVYEFSKEKIHVYGLLTEPGQHTTIFSVFGSKLGRHSWIITQINMSNVFRYQCQDDDYKNWTPSDDTGHECLLGRTVTYRRRIAHSQCFNGENMVHINRTANCSCTRVDFECDYGFKPAYEHYGRHRAPCVIDTNSSVDVHRIPATCYSGGVYYRSKGYRKVAGDSCSGGGEQFMAPDELTCPMSDKQEFLLYSNKTAIHKYILGTGQDIVIPTYGLKNVIAVDYDYQDDCVYWADVEDDDIKRLCLRSDSSIEGVQEVIVRGDMDSVQGLAFDWMADNLYWLDAGNKSIEVARKDGSYRRRLIYNTAQNKKLLEKPRSLALDPRHGYMYWADWSATNPKIMRAQMDGSNPIEFVSGTSEIHWPNGVAIDDQRETIYWTEAYNDKIMMAPLNGYTSASRTNVTVLIRGAQVPHPYAIAVYKDEIYWTDWSRNGILTADKYTGHGVRMVKSGIRAIMDLKVLHKASQQGSNACTVANGRGCSYLCLARPQLSSRVGNRTCRCPDAMIRSVAPGGSGDESCQCASGKLIVNGTCVSKGNSSTCALSQFRCENSGRCIRLSWRCDHDNDCGDMSDERDCAFKTCSAYQFTCLNTGRCIALSWKCDHDDDCGDGSDEQGCAHTTCDSRHFQCGNGRCIPKTWLCDGDNDCHDHTDENNCNVTTTTPTPHPQSCSSEQFTCTRRHQCIPGSWKCDGAPDCIDGSDERNCHQNVTTCDGTYQFRCTNSGRCIYKSWVCDGDNDCGDMSDEQNCPTHPPTHYPTTAPSRCTQFQCRNMACVFYSDKCDGVNDCGDWSDEYDCLNLTTPRPRTCASYEFTCSNGQCISQYYRCNSHQNCADNSDERNCHGTCAGNRFRCRDGQCIPRSWVCDQDRDCTSGEDEDECQVTCPVSNFRCTTSSGCIPRSWLCDGKNDCLDHSDEYGCATTTVSAYTTTAPRCMLGQFQCRTIFQCIPIYYRCNNHYDCADMSDESGCAHNLIISSFMVDGLPSYNSISIKWKAPNADQGLSYIIQYSEDANSWRNRTTSQTHYTFTKLAPITPYMFRVYVNQSGHVFSPSNFLTARTSEGLPSKPKHLHVTAGPVSVTWNLLLAWNLPDHPNGIIIHYNIYWNSTCSKQVHSEQMIPQDNQGTLHYTLDAVQEACTYSVWVTASTRAGEGKRSDTKTQLVGAGAIPIDKKVGNVQCSNRKDGQVTLTWTPLSASDTKNFSVIGYFVEYVLNNKLINHNVTATSYVVTNLSPGTLYLFEVGPRNQLSYGSTTQMSCSTTGQTIQQVKDVEVLSISGNAVTVSWSAPTHKVSKWQYKVYYDYSQPYWTSSMPSKSTTATQLEINNLLSCEDYRFWVQVTKPLAGPEPDHPVTVRMPYDPLAAPKHLAVKELPDHPGTVNISWGAACEFTGPVSYQITIVNKLTGQHSMSILAPNNATNLWVNRTNFDRGATYDISVKDKAEKAKDVHQTLNISAYLPPQQLEIELLQTRVNSVRLLWQPPAETIKFDFKYQIFMKMDKSTYIMKDEVNKTKQLWELKLARGHVYSFKVRIMPNPSTKLRPGQFSRELLWEAPFAEPSGGLPPTITNVAAIAGGVCGAIVIALGIAFGVFYVRHRRLQRSFLSFANSHYDTRSGTTTFSSDLDDAEDSPMIRGFSDDEPLVMA